LRQSNFISSGENHAKRKRGKKGVLLTSVDEVENAYTVLAEVREIPSGKGKASARGREQKISETKKKRNRAHRRGIARGRGIFLQRGEFARTEKPGEPYSFFDFFNDDENPPSQSRQHKRDIDSGGEEKKRQVPESTTRQGRVRTFGPLKKTRGGEGRVSLKKEGKIGAHIPGERGRGEKSGVTREGRR